MRSYIVRVRTAPDRRVVNKEYSYVDQDKAHSHLNRLLKQGWKASLELRLEVEA